jgi:hypothetical protein
MARSASAALHGAQARDLMAHAPKRLADEVAADYADI